MAKVNEIMEDEDNIEEGKLSAHYECDGESSITKNDNGDINRVDVVPKGNGEVKNVTIDEHENCIAAGQINALGAQLAELSLRLAKIDLRIANLENNNGFSGQSPSASLKSIIQQVRSISNQVEIITEGLRSTPGYNIGKTFNCNSCRSMGTVAIKVRCTTCDHENWWGWWPQRK